MPGCLGPGCGPNLTANNSHRYHRTAATLPKSFSRGPSRILSNSGQSCVDIFGILPRSLENFLESENLVCSTTARTKPHQVSSNVGSIISRHLYSNWHILFQGSLGGRCPGNWNKKIKKCTLRKGHMTCDVHKILTCILQNNI